LEAHHNKLPSTASAGKYFAAILVDTVDYPGWRPNRFAVIDFGIKALAVASEGLVVAAHQQVKAPLFKAA
jgi:hypothetical protein